MNKDQIEPKIKDSLIRIGKEFKLDLIILFGSRAKNTHKENSDYDIAIYSYKKISENKEYKIFKKMQEIFKEKEFDLTNLNNILNITLQYSIFKDGIVIYESNNRILIEKYNESFFNYIDFMQYKNIRKEALLS